MADTRGIRELAREFLLITEGWDTTLGDHTLDDSVESYTAFAESIVEQEQDAIIGLIEAFMNDCNDGKWQPKKLIESIRSRWQRGEGL